MLGIGIMRGEQYDYVLSKQTPQGSYFWGQSVKGRWGRCDSKAASAQGSSLLSKADLSAGKHLLTLRSLQRDCLDPHSRALKAKQVMWISMRPWCHSQACKALVGQETHSPGQRGLGWLEHLEMSVSLSICSNLVTMGSFKTNVRGRSWRRFYLK